MSEIFPPLLNSLFFTDLQFFTYFVKKKNQPQQYLKVDDIYNDLLEAKMHRKQELIFKQGSDNNTKTQVIILILTLEDSLNIIL